MCEKLPNFLLMTLQQFRFQLMINECPFLALWLLMSTPIHLIFVSILGGNYQHTICIHTHVHAHRHPLLCFVGKHFSSNAKLFIVYKFTVPLYEVLLLFMNFELLCNFQFCKLQVTERYVKSVLLMILLTCHCQKLPLSQ